jgi:hypothetical protein
MQGLFSMGCPESFHIAESRETAQEQNNPVSFLPTTVLNSMLAIPIRRRGKSMSRRVGQNGEVFVKQLRGRDYACPSVKSLGP